MPWYGHGPKINDPYNTMGTPAARPARRFTSGLYRPGSTDDRADAAAFESAVTSEPGIDKARVRRMAKAEAEVVSRLRAGNTDPASTGLSDELDHATRADRNAFYRYLHARPQRG